ncbi:hypothetical protein DVH05_018110 [Phytophthora capsici]|nr:hypothetical protein DVH05_018110 [Phytophthora capsici]
MDQERSGRPSAHTRDVLDYFDNDHILDETISQFYGDLSGSGICAKKKQIHKWSKQAPTIRAAFYSYGMISANIGPLKLKNMQRLLRLSYLRSLGMWINRLRDQLVAYRAKEKQRQEKSDKLQREIIRVRNDLAQEEPESEV